MTAKTASPQLVRHGTDARGETAYVTVTSTRSAGHLLVQSHGARPGHVAVELTDDTIGAQTHDLSLADLDALTAWAAGRGADRIICRDGADRTGTTLIASRAQWWCLVHVVTGGRLKSVQVEHDDLPALAAGLAALAAIEATHAPAAAGA